MFTSVLKIKGAGLSVHGHPAGQEHSKVGMFLAGNGKRQGRQTQDTEVWDFRGNREASYPLPKMPPLPGTAA